MDAAPDYIPLWFDLTAVFIGGLGGSLIAIRNHLDPAGVLVITLVSALGGGILRDVLIQRGTPAALANPDYLYTAMAAAGVGFLFRRLVTKVDSWFLLIDAAALGVYTMVGMDKGLNASLPVITAAMLGVITATGGGLMRDVLSGEMPNLLRPGQLALTASVAGTILYAVFNGIGFNQYVSVWIVIGFVMGLRLASHYFGWTTPAADEMPEPVGYVGSKVLPAHPPVRLPTLPTYSRRNRPPAGDDSQDTSK